MVFICPRCKLTSKVRHLADTHTCPHCNYTLTLSWKEGSTNLNSLHEAICICLERNSIAKSELDFIQLQVQPVNDATCINCSHPLNITEKSLSKVTCRYCQTHNFLEHLSIPYLSLALHTTKTWTKDKNVAVKCVACGANLTLKNKSRVQTCPFCNTENLLPDEAWHAINPELNLQPFYIGIENINLSIEKVQNTTDQDVLVYYAEHFYYKVRVAVAKNEHITENVARLLAQDKNYYVHQALKEHPKFDQWFETKLFKDEEEAREFALNFPHETNPNLTHNEMMNLAKQKMPRRLTALCYNPSITPEVMKQILRQDIYEATLALSKRLDLTQEIVILLARKDYSSVNYNIADNPLLPEIYMQKFALSSDPEIIEKLLENPALTDTVRQML
ncbi:MAG: hypothetical protein RML94_14770 [Bacteroidia bacterium]|nr:hypothetical protein [Bacteroidia bacterium]